MSLVFDFEILGCLKIERLRDENLWERLDAGVENPYRAVVVATGILNMIFSLAEIFAQLSEIFISFQVGVGFSDKCES